MMAVHGGSDVPDAQCSVLDMDMLFSRTLRLFDIPNCYKQLLL